MIRRAVMEDLPAMVAMAAKFHAAVPHLSGIQFSQMSATAAFARSVQNPRNAVWVIEADCQARGVLVAEEVDYPCGPAIFVKEALLWIDPEYRGRWGLKLIRAFEGWARSRGAVLMGVTVQAEGRAQALMERVGYRMVEVNLLKVL